MPVLRVMTVPLVKPQKVEECLNMVNMYSLRIISNFVEYKSLMSHI